MPERKDSRSRRGSRRRKPRGEDDSARHDDTTVPPPPVGHYDDQPGVNREEVAAREAGIYDEEPAESPGKPADRQARGSRSRGRRRRPRRERKPDPAPAEPDDEERVEWWDEIEDELPTARDIDEEEEKEETADGPEAKAPPEKEEPEEETQEEEAEEEEDGFLAGIFPEEEEDDHEESAKPAAAKADEPEEAQKPEPEAEKEAAERAEEAPPEPEPSGPDIPETAPGVSRRWIREVWAKAVEKRPERREAFRTSSGVELAPLYGPSISAAKAFDGAVGYPGEFPFTRGVQATMYRGRHWTMRQYAGFGSARATNERFRYLLEQGQTGLSVAFDLPTQIGYDSDDPAAEGEVGKVGVPINSLKDMEVLLEGIPLDQVSLSMTINSTAAVLLLMVVAVAKKQGVPLDQIRGTVQNDMLKEFVARNTYRFSLDAHLRLVTDLFCYSSSKLPKFNMISISGYHMREAGCTAVQEVAFTLANAIAYVEKAVEAGLDVDAFAGRLSFFFGAHNHLFEEVAKFRAARRLWAKIMTDRFGAKNPRSKMLRFHTQTCGSTLTARQPKVNVVRVAIQALASVLGGTQSLHTNSWDEALSLPSKESALLALRTQQVLANESGVTDVVDPLGGSPLVEELTDAIEKGAVEYIAKIDELGGAPAAIKSGWMKGEIESAAYQAQKDIEAGEQVVVGVNEFTMDEEGKPEVFPVDEEQAKTVLADLGKLREERDDARVEASLAALEISAAWGDADLPELILECVESYCTIGEICSSLETVLAQEP